MTTKKYFSDCHSAPPLFNEPGVFTHGYDFDPAYGMDLAHLLAAPRRIRLPILLPSGSIATLRR